MEAQKATTDEAQSENTQTFDGNAEDMATIAKVSWNMGKDVTIVSEDGETHLHEELNSAQEQGKFAHVEEEPHDPSGSMRRLCVMLFYFTIGNDDKVIISE